MLKFAGMRAKIARLRAEVERLTHEKNHCAEIVGHSGIVIRERDEALAQVAVLFSANLHALIGHDAATGFSDLCAFCLWRRNYLAEACALLDRLRRAEAVVTQVNILKTALGDSTVVLDNLRRDGSLRIAQEGSLGDQFGIVTAQIHKNQAALRGEEAG